MQRHKVRGAPPLKATPPQEQGVHLPFGCHQKGPLVIRKVAILSLDPGSKHCECLAAENAPLYQTGVGVELKKLSLDINFQIKCVPLHRKCILEVICARHSNP